MTMPSAHLRVEQLADLAEGLLEPPRASQVREHLAGCAQCSALGDDLASTRQLLALDGSAPPRMPGDLVARLDAAFAAERPSSSSASPARSATPARRSWHFTALVAAASVAVLGAAIGFGASRLGDQPQTNAAAARSEVARSSPEQHGAPQKVSPGPAPGGPDTSPTHRSTSFNGLSSADLGAQLGERLAAVSKAGPLAGGSPSLDEPTRSCLRSALHRALSPASAVYPAELDGRHVQIVVGASAAGSRRAVAIDCTGTPRVVARATVPPG